METDNAGSAPSPHLLYLGQKSTKRLLEVYVKRSLSLNDTSARRQRVKPRKWVIVDNKGTRIRKASSDSSTHRLSREILNTDQPKEPYKDTTRDSKQKEIKRRTKRVTKKTSILRGFLSLFSRKTHEVENCSVPDSPASGGSSDSCFAPETCPPVPEKIHEERDRAIPHPAKSIKKRLSLKKLSFRNHDADKSNSVKTQTSLAPVDVVRVPDV